jgi:Asp-tRNA(Asn)/Glu-tRNA(Gln) amidotransferase A subunit family amidase
MSQTLPTRLAGLIPALRSGTLSLPAYLSQLEGQFAAREAEVQAFIPENGRFARLRQEAAALAARYPDPAGRPPLYGVPVGVKDIFHVDGFVTQAGSRVPPDLLAGPESTAVSRLRAAGALILGKMVTTEFAYFGPGITRNPHNPNHTPGGSSSGSAAAVGAGLAPLTLGTQTVGSIIRPAAFCGVVGFKPSYGRISAAGVIPLSTSVDHIGFFCQDAAGAALVAAVLAQEWQAAKGQNLAKPVLGVPEGPYLERTEAEGLAHFRQVQRILTAAGYDLRPVAVMADFEEICHRHNSLVAAEAAVTHRAWFASFSGLYHPKTTELIERGQGISPEQVEQYRAGRAALRQTLETVRAEQGISLWIAPPALGPAPLSLESTGDPVMNLPWSHAGLPALNLPAGRAGNGLPLGLQLIGGWGQDEALLAWAQDIEAILAGSG